MLYAPYLPRWRKLLVPFTLKQPVCQAIQCHFSYHWCSFYVVAEFQKAWNITVNKYTHTYSYAVHRDLSGVFLRLYCVISFTRTTHAKTVFAMFFFLESIYLYRHCVHLPCTTYVSWCCKEYIRDLRCEWCVAARVYFFTYLQLTIKQLFTNTWTFVNFFFGELFFFNCIALCAVFGASLADQSQLVRADNERLTVRARSRGDALERQ